MSSLEGLVGNFKIQPTLSRILTSLGHFKDFSVRPVHARALAYDYSLAGHVPFSLSADGSLFFQKYLGIENLHLLPEAHLLVLEKEAGFIDYPGKSPEEEALCQGLKAFPFGVLVSEENGDTHLLDLSLLLLGAYHAQNFYSASIAGNIWNAIFPDRQIKSEINIYSESTGNIPGPIEYFLQDNFQFGGKLTLLSVAKKLKKGTFEPPAIFSFQDPNCTDYLTAILQQALLFLGKSVFVLGYGSGIDLIYPARLGARAVFGNDSPLCRLIAGWNVQYAQDTGQITEEQAATIHQNAGEGFENAPAADIDLFNAPAIHSAAFVKGQAAIYGDEKTRNKCIPEKVFLHLFKEQQRRLLLPIDQGSSPPVALWRILPAEPSDKSPLTHFPDPKPETIKRFGPLDSCSLPDYKNYARACEFLEAQQNLASVPVGYGSEFFLFWDRTKFFSPPPQPLLSPLSLA